MKLSFDPVFTPTVLHPSVETLVSRSAKDADSWVVSAVCAQDYHLIVLFSACEKPRRLHYCFSIPLLHIGFSPPGNLQTGGTSDLRRLCPGLFTSSPFKQLFLILLLFSFQNNNKQKCESIDHNSFTFWGLSWNHGDTFLSLRVIFASLVRKNYFASRQKEALRGKWEAACLFALSPWKWERKM